MKYPHVWQILGTLSSAMDELTPWFIKRQLQNGNLQEVTLESSGRKVTFYKKIVWSNQKKGRISIIYLAPGTKISKKNLVDATMSNSVFIALTPSADDVDINDDVSADIHNASCKNHLMLMLVEFR